MENVEIDHLLDCMTTLFITDEMFEELAAPKRNMEDAIDWYELPVNIIYQVKFLIPVQTKYGNKSLLVLNDKDGLEIKVWAPVNVSKELKICKNNNAYIKSLGEKVGKTSSGKSKRYYDFETVYV